MTTTYSTDAMVYFRIDDAQHTDFDTIIDAMRVYAQSIIDDELQNFESSLPLSSPTQLIKEIEADIAAGLVIENKFERTDELREKASWLQERGMIRLEKHIQNTYVDDSRKRTGSPGPIRKNYSQQFYEVNEDDDA